MIITHTHNFEQGCNFTYAPCDQNGNVLPHLWVYALPEPHETNITDICGWFYCGDLRISIPENALVYEVGEAIHLGINTSTPTRILGVLDISKIELQYDYNLPLFDTPYCGHLVMFPTDAERFFSFEKKPRGASRFPFEVLREFCAIEYEDLF